MAEGDAHLYKLGFQIDSKAFDELLADLRSFASQAESGFGSGSDLAVPGGLGEGTIPGSDIHGAVGSLAEDLKALAVAGKFTSEQFKEMSQVINKAIDTMDRARIEANRPQPTAPEGSTRRLVEDRSIESRIQSKQSQDERRKAEQRRQDQTEVDAADAQRARQAKDEQKRQRAQALVDADRIKSQTQQREPLLPDLHDPGFVEGGYWGWPSQDEDSRRRLLSKDSERQRRAILAKRSERAAEVAAAGAAPPPPPPPSPPGGTPEDDDAAEQKRRRDKIAADKAKEKEEERRKKDAKRAQDLLDQEEKRKQDSTPSIDKVLPAPPAVLKDSALLALDPANKQDLDDRLRERAAHAVNIRKLENLDSITTNIASTATDSVTLEAQGNVVRSHLNALLKKQEFEEERKAARGGVFDPVALEAENNVSDRVRRARVQATEAELLAANPRQRDRLAIDTATGTIGQQKTAADVARRVSESQLGDEDFIKDKANASIATKRRVALQNEAIAKELSTDDDYIKSRAATIASNKSRAARERSNTEQVLAADRDYIKATAETANARRESALKIAAETRKQAESGTFDFTTETAKENVLKRRDAARIDKAESDYLTGSVAGKGIREDIGRGDAGKKISAAAIDAEEAKALASSKNYTRDVAEAAAFKKIQASEVQAATIEEVKQVAIARGTTAEALLAQGIIAQQALDENVKLKVIQAQLQVERKSLGLSDAEILAQEQALDATQATTRQKLLTAQKQLQVATREGAQRVYTEQGFDESGTRFQRAQALIDIRRNGAVRDPSEYQTLGAFFGQRALNTFGYLTSGVAFYGIFDQFKSAVKETEDAQRALQVLKATFETTDQAGRFTETRSALLSIADETGRLGSETTNTFRQLYGALGQNVDAALSATRQSNKFAQVTGLDPKEITDSLTAISLSFGQTDFSPFLDQAVSLEGQFGVLASETVQFAADLAPLASQLGFTAEQLEAFGAAAQSVSGKSGGALAEQLSRVFEVFTDPKKTTDLANVIATQLPEAFSSLSRSLGSGDVEKSFELLLSNLDKLDKSGAVDKAKALRDALVNVAGGPRQAGALAAVLARPQITLDALQGKVDPTGSVDKRFEEVQKSLEQSFERIKRGIEELFQALLTSGLADAFVSLGGAIEGAINAATHFLSVFTDINDMFGGIIGQIAFATAGVLAFSKAITAIGDLQLLRAFLPGLAGLGAGAAAGAAATAGPAGGVGFVSSAAAAASTAAPAVGTGGLLASVTGIGAKLKAADPVLLKGLSPLLTKATYAFAALKLVELYQSFQDLNDTVGEGRAFIHDQVLKALEKGLTPDEIRKQAKGAGGEDHAQTHLEVFGLRLTPDFSVPDLPGLPQVPTGSQLTDEALTEIDNNKKQQQLAALDEAIKHVDGSNKEKLDAYVRQAQHEAPLETYIGDGLRVADGSNIQDLPGIIAALKQDPHSKKNLETVQKILDFAANNLPPSVKDAIVAAVNDATNDTGLTPAQQADQDQQTDLETALAKVKAGIGSRTELRDLGQKRLEVVNQLIADSANDRRVQNAHLLERAQLQKEVSDALSADIKQEQQDRNAILSVASGKADPVQQIAASRELLAEPGLAPADRSQAILDIFTAQKQQFDEYVSEATSAQDKLNRIAEGKKKFAFDPLLRQDLIKIQVDKDQNSQAQIRAASESQLAIQGSGSEPVDALSNVEHRGVLSDVVATMTQNIANAMTNLGLTYKQAITSILFSQKAIVDTEKNALSKIPLVGPVIAIGLDQESQGISKQIEDINNSLATGPADTGPGPTVDPQALADAQKAAAAEQLKIAQAYEDLAAAQSHGDPVAVAKANVRKAELAVAGATNPLEAVEAQIQLVQAQNELEDANVAIGQAYLQYLQAVSTNPVQAAQFALQAADDAVEHAHGEAARLQAMAQRVSAERALQDAINNVINSQIELLIAISNAAGDTVTAANQSLYLAVTKLNQTKASRPDDEAAINQAQGAVVAAERAAADAALQRQEDDIQFELDMHKITTGQAVNLLKNLLLIPTNTEAENREIQRQIQQLTQQLQSDFKFNLPTVLGLPTAYEARRVNQGGQQSGAYQDNRVITVQVYASTNADPQQIANAVADAFGSPQATSTYAKRYGLGV